VASTAQVREILRARDFRRLYSTRLVSAAADGIFQTALASYVFSPRKTRRRLAKQPPPSLHSCCRTRLPGPLSVSSSTAGGANECS